MKVATKIAGLILLGLLATGSYFANADDVSDNSPPGVAQEDNGMEPDPLPLAPPDLPALKPTGPNADVKPENNPMMEKCHVLDKDGNGLIKPYMADSGPSLEGDATAWIWVPHGQCKKLNAGDFNGVTPEIRNKIENSDVTTAITLD